MYFESQRAMWSERRCVMYSQVRFLMSLSVCVGCYATFSDFTVACSCCCIRGARAQTRDDSRSPSTSFTRRWVAAFREPLEPRRGVDDKIMFEQTGCGYVLDADDTGEWLLCTQHACVFPSGLRGCVCGKRCSVKWHSPIADGKIRKSVIPICWYNSVIFPLI